MAKITPHHTDALGRDFFEHETTARKYLAQEGFVLDESNRFDRYPWKYGLVEADLRFNADWFFIDYRA